MKTLIGFLAMASVVVATAGCSDSSPGVDAQPSASRLQAASDGPAAVRWKNGTLRTVKGRFTGAGALETPSDRAESFVNDFADALGLVDPAADLSGPTILASDPGGTAVVFERRVNDISVYGAQVRVHVATDGAIDFVSAGLPVIAPDFDTDPALSPQDAGAAAIAAAGLEGAEVVTSALVIWDAGLFFADTKSQPILAYRVALSGAAASMPVLFVDAADGKTLYHFNEVASGTAYIYTSVDLPDESVDLSATVGGHRDERGVFIGQSACSATVATCQGYSPQTPLCCGLNTLSLVDGVAQVGGADPGTYAVDQLLADVQTYVQSELSLDGWDQKAGDIHAFAHLGRPTFRDAYWVPVFKTFLFGALAASPDVVAHEWAHAINSGSLWPLGLSGEQGAIGEAMGDILAAVKSDGWVLHALRTDGSPTWVFRDLTADGAARAIADTTTTLKDPQDAEDNGHVHFNSGIISRTAELAAHGKTHPTTAIAVAKIGPRKVLHIYFRALRLYMVPTTTLRDARWQIEAACISLIDWPNYPVTITYEDCGALINAFAAVGLGGQDRDLDTWEDASDNCQGEYPESFNPEQLDSDGDGVGDLCQDEPDLPTTPDPDATATLSGTVLRATTPDDSACTAPISGSCYVPVGEAAVQAYSEDGLEISQAEARADGTFVLKGLTDSTRYEIVAAADGMASRHVALKLATFDPGATLRLSPANTSCVFDDARFTLGDFDALPNYIGAWGGAVGWVGVPNNQTRSLGSEAAIICISGSAIAPTFAWDDATVREHRGMVTTLKVIADGQILWSVTDGGGLSQPVVFGQGPQVAPTLTPETPYTVVLESGSASRRTRAEWTAR